MRETPKFIYFDLGNVLLTFDHCTARDQLSKLCDVPADKVWDALFANGLQDRYEQGAVTSQEVYESFCSETMPDGQGWPTSRSFHLANSDMFQLNVPVIAIVAHLQSAGYPLGILSNTCEEHWKHVSSGRFTVLERCFRTAVLSYEEKCSKPDPRIFQVATERVGVAPGEIFFMDDRRENVEGARAAGFDAVWYQSPQQLAGDLRGRGVRFNY